MLYKTIRQKKGASFRQGCWCVLIGAISGVYGFQSILKIFHKDEGGLVLKLVGVTEEVTIQPESGESAQQE